MAYEDDDLLTRQAAAFALTDAGFPVSPATLATKRRRPTLPTVWTSTPISLGRCTGMGARTSLEAGRQHFRSERRLTDGAPSSQRRNPKEGAPEVGHRALAAQLPLR